MKLSKPMITNNYPWGKEWRGILLTYGVKLNRDVEFMG